MSLLLIKVNIINNSAFIIVPRIGLIDKEISKTTCLVLGLIVSLTFKNDYCYASNKYLADYLNVSKRTITDSLSLLKKLNYIIIKYEDNNRRIYLNKEKVSLKIAMGIEKNCNTTIAETCDHNINNKYKNNIFDKYDKTKQQFKKEGIVPEWLVNPELTKKVDCTPEEIAELEELFKEFK